MADALEGAVESSGELDLDLDVPLFTNMETDAAAIPPETYTCDASVCRTCHGDTCG